MNFDRATSKASLCYDYPTQLAFQTTQLLFERLNDVKLLEVAYATPRNAFTTALALS